MLNTEQAKSIIARGTFWVDAEGQPIEPQGGQFFCMFSLQEDTFDGVPILRDGSLVEYVGDGRVVSANCDDEDKDDYSPGGEFEDFAVLQA